MALERWRPVGAAVSFVVATVAGLAGNQLTVGHVTLALFVFAVLRGRGDGDLRAGAARAGCSGRRARRG